MPETIGGWEDEGIFGQLRVGGGSGDNVVTVVGDGSRPVTMQVMRFADASEPVARSPRNLRVYTRQGPDNPDYTWNLSAEIDQYSNQGTEAVALNVTATKYGAGFVTGIHATQRDFHANLVAPISESPGVNVMETGILAHGPDDPTSVLGKRQGFRFVPKSFCGDNKRGTRPGIGEHPACPTLEASATEIGVGYAVVINNRQYNAGVRHGFAAVEVTPRNSFGNAVVENAFYSETSGEAGLVIRGTPTWGIDLGGHAVLLRRDPDGAPVTLDGVLAAYESRIAQLEHKIERLQRRVGQMRRRR